MLNKKQKLWILAVLGTLVLTIGLAFLSQKTALFKGVGGFPTPDFSGIGDAVTCASKTSAGSCISTDICIWNLASSRCEVRDQSPSPPPPAQSLEVAFDSRFTRESITQNTTGVVASFKFNNKTNSPIFLTKINLTINNGVNPTDLIPMSSLSDFVFVKNLSNVNTDNPNLASAIKSPTISSQYGNVKWDNNGQTLFVLSSNQVTYISLVAKVKADAPIDKIIRFVIFNTHDGMDLNITPDQNISANDPVSGGTVGVIQGAPPAIPDLAAENLSWTPDPITTGTQVTFSANVKNYGGTAASNFSVHFCIDNPSCATTPAGRVGISDSIHVGPLTENQTWSTQSVPWTATEGNHEIQFCVDVTAGIAEASEENNCAKGSFVVGPAGGSPPLTDGELPFPVISSNQPTPPNNGTSTTLTPTIKWAPGAETPAGTYYYYWYLSDTALQGDAAIVLKHDPEWQMASNSPESIKTCGPTITGKSNTWACQEVTIPAGILQYGHSYMFGLRIHSADGKANPWCDDAHLGCSEKVLRYFNAPAVPTLAIAASTPANQGTTLNPGIQFVKAISINLTKTGGDNAVDKISAITLNLIGDFPRSKLKNEELWVEGVKVNATMAKNPTNDTLTITLPPNYLIAADKKFILYVKAEVAEVDANRKFQYKVTGITTDPAGMIKTYSGGGPEAAGPEFTVAEAAEELTCANGKVVQGGACACPAGKNEFSGGITYYTPSVCIPCTTAQLISSGGFYCPQDKPAAPPPPPPPPPPPGGSPSPPPPPPETGLQACAAKGKYAYTGPPKPGVRTPGMCIDCSTELYIKLGGKCEAEKKTDDSKTITSTAGTGGTDGKTKTDSQTSEGKTDTITSGVTGGTGSGGTRGTAPSPGLQDSQRLVRAPERGQVGPGVGVYFGILAAIQGGIWIKRRLKK